MLALRLTRGAHLAVHLRRLLVAAASAGTGFLLLCSLGHAMNHPDEPGTSALRLVWCAVPVAATAYLAVAVARTDPATRPRPGLSAIGLGPGRLMAVSAATTALSGALGSLLALLLFLHLRGDPAGTPFDGAAADALAPGRSLPLPAALTLLALVPVTASAASALALRPREPRPARDRAARGYGRFGAYGPGAARETFGAYGRFGARLNRAPSPTAAATDAPAPTDDAQPASSRSVPGGAPHPAASADGAPQTPDAPDDHPGARGGSGTLPWGIAVLAAGLAVETYASRATAPTSDAPAAGVLVGWSLATVGLALAGPGLTHLCGRLLQAVRPGALRLLAGRVLMEEASRIGRPLGVVCAVASAAYAAAALYDADGGSFGPLRTLGALLVAGCAVATLLTAAVEAKHARADTTATLLRLGAPPVMLRSAAALRACALLAVFGPLTLIVAELAALPLTR
ncbi:hypothetical protein ACWD00_28590 [Streptomyces viridiviolaceus]